MFAEEVKVVVDSTMLSSYKRSAIVAGKWLCSRADMTDFLSLFAYLPICLLFLFAISLSYLFAKMLRPSVIVKCSRDGVRSVSTLMRAWQCFDYDSPMQLNEGVKIPPLRSPNDVIIEVSAASVNPIDVKMKGGYGRTYLNLLRRLDDPKTVFNPKSEFPLTFGRDCSGVVVDVGGGVDKFRVGDQVYCAPQAHRNGTFAEFLVTSAANVAKKPHNLTHIEAASIPYVACTVWAALSKVARLKSSNTKGKRVLIHGGSGGIGSFAIQLMKAWGAEVTATCGSSSIELVRSLKADHIVNYQAEDYNDRLVEFCPYDVILDPIGSVATLGSSKCLGLWRGCIYVGLTSPVLTDGDTLGFPVGLVKSVVSWATSSFEPLTKGRLFSWAFFSPDGSALAEICKLIEAEQIIPLVEEVFDFTKLPEAMDKVAKGHGRGKTVVAVKPT